MRTRAKCERAAALGLALIALSSCLTGSADFSMEKRAIEAATGLTLTADSSVRVGAATLRLARWFGAEESDADDVLRHVQRVEVAVFHVQGGDARRAVDAFPSPPGWTCLVRARQRDSSARIFLEEPAARSAAERPPRGTAKPAADLSSLLVATSEGEQLVLVRIRGAFEALVEHALARRSRLPSKTAAGLRAEGGPEGD